MPRRNPSAARAESESLVRYYNASQLRADTWNRLKGLTARLAQARESGQRPRRLEEEVTEALDLLGPFEDYWAFPGFEAFARLRALAEAGDYPELAHAVRCILRGLMSGAYRYGPVALGVARESEPEDGADPHDEQRAARPYFELLVVDSLGAPQQQRLRDRLLEMRRPEDGFTYVPVVASSFEDALIAVLFNHNIQAVVIRYDFPFHSLHKLELLQRYLARAGHHRLGELSPDDYGPALAEAIGRLRPELDVYLVTNQSVEEVAAKVGRNCRRVFYDQEDYLELHLNVLRGVESRFETPFFNALKRYSKRPTGVFHAMPISRGKSISKSHWIRDMGDFYGMNIFLAETSATSGGLDSLLEPTGPLKQAQQYAARAFGARHTFFATNGTSTCNKIVVQALVRPGDIVLVDRDCHKSHHYGMVLSGAEVVYLDSYPLSQYSMYGAVPLAEIKRQLFQLRRAGKIDRVKVVLLTNCTFDGIIYNVERVMEECLAIKPDLVFLWDEAWFGFARFGPTYRQRTAMHAAAMLRERYAGAAYRRRYAAYLRKRKSLDPDLDASWVAHRLMPVPERVRVRVYATQSTHKTLTALRQGSMIHIHDQDYSARVEEPFHEAYMTHTSTSPNYQILASLDVGRRQVELEGFELVQKQVEMAMVLRQRIATHPLLKKYFRVLTVADMVPARYRESGIESYFDAEHGWVDVWDAWTHDEFTVDATRVTLLVGATGLDGNAFKTEVLMDRYGIQVNKTSRNTVLFMTNIGTTRSSTAYLIEVLVQIAQDLDRRLADASPVERRLHEKKVRSVTVDLPPLPDFSRFHAAFRSDPDGDTPEGNIRKAFFLAYDDTVYEYLSLSEARESTREMVSAAFITPYPPGFPILVPGQVITAAILDFMVALDVKEIHGYRPELGLRVFTAAALAAALGNSVAGEAPHPGVGASTEQPRAAEQ